MTVEAVRSWLPNSSVGRASDQRFRRLVFKFWSNHHASYPVTTHKTNLSFAFVMVHLLWLLAVLCRGLHIQNHTDNQQTVLPPTSFLQLHSMIKECNQLNSVKIIIILLGFRK